MERIRCALWVPVGADVRRWALAEAAVAEREGWEIVSLVRDWDELAQLMRTSQIDIGLIPTHDHLAPDRLPRLVAAADEHRSASRPALAQQRRPAIRWVSRRGPGHR